MHRQPHVGQISDLLNHSRRCAWLGVNWLIFMTWILIGITHSMTAMTAWQTSIGTTSDRKRADWTVEKIFLAMRTRWASRSFLADMAFSHKLDSIGRRRWWDRKILQNFCSLWQQSITVENVGIGFLQTIVEDSIRISEETSINLVNPIVVEAVAPRVASGLSLEVLGHHPSWMLHHSLRGSVERCYRVIRRHALLWDWGIQKSSISIGLGVRVICIII